MFNSVFNFYWPTNGGCVGNQTFVSILSGHFICICTVYSCTSGWPLQRNDSLQPHRFINDNINIIIFEMQHKSIRSPPNELSFH